MKHKEWKAYPKLRPIAFESEEGGAEQLEEVVVEDGESVSPEQKQAVFEKKHATQKKHKEEQQAQKKAVEAWGQVEVVPGVFYVNSFEPLISVSFYFSLAFVLFVPHTLMYDRSVIINMHCYSPPFFFVFCLK